MNEQPQEFPFDVKHLQWMLSRAHNREEAERRAKNMTEDMAALKIEPILTCFPLGDGHYAWHYRFGKPDFSPDNLHKSNTADTLKAMGFGMSWGEPHMWSLVCEFGRKLWGAEWPLRFRKKLVHFPDHLSTIEELFWLSLWLSPRNVENEVCIGNAAASVDWRFETCTQVVNLEVKLRPKDWKRVVDGPLFSSIQPSIFEGVKTKFPIKNPNELNLVGITLLAPLNRECGDLAQQFLSDAPCIDGVLFWSTGTKKDQPFAFHLKPHAAFARNRFSPTKEHFYRMTLIVHPWRHREERRMKRCGIEEDLSTIDGVNRKVGRIILPGSGSW